MHRPTMSADHRGEELPAFDCHTGIAGWDARRLHYTTSPINCLRCLAKGPAHPIPQIALFAVDELLGELAINHKQAEGAGR